VKKKMAFLLLVCLLLCAAVPAALAETLVWVDDIQYSIDKDYAKVVDYRGADSELVIPSTVTVGNAKKTVASIGSRAFVGCSSLQNVTIFEGVTSIDIAAFEGCANMKSITIPDSVTSIGSRAFYCCYALESIAIPNGVTTIDGAFYACTNLESVTIPNSVTTIGFQAFRDCENLRSITIPKSVTTIKPEAFYGCKSLKSVTIPNSVTSIGDRAFDSSTILHFEKGPELPKTGDESNVILWSALACISLFGMATLIRKKKEA